MLSVLKFFVWLILIIALIGGVLVVIDRLVLRHVKSPTHSEQTAALPMLDENTANGWVRIPVGNFEFRAHVANLDQKDAEPVILLHGFPETSQMWGPLFDKLKASGYRVVAFDQRGYSPGARPEQVSAYALENMVQDLVGVADTVGFKRFHLVGHDWGSVVGWLGVSFASDRIASFSSLSVAHMSAWREAFKSKESDQRQRSSYMPLLRMKFVPETLFLFNNGYILHTKVYNRMKPELREFYLQVFLESGTFTSALNWYRALDLKNSTKLPSVTVPTLYLWGNKDSAVSRMAAEKTKDYVSGPYRFVEIDASHWLMSDVPDQISQEVIAHLVKNKI